MDKLYIDLKLLIKDDINKIAYNNLLMFCHFDEEINKNPSILHDQIFIFKYLYPTFNFNGVQREPNELLEYNEFIRCYYTLHDVITNFYKLRYDHKKIIENNITTFNNSVKPFKTDLLDFCKYIDLYYQINQIGLKEYIDIIIKYKKLFVQLLNYDKDIQTNYHDCLYNDFAEYIKMYKYSVLPLQWMIQALLSNKHFKCVDSILSILLNSANIEINDLFIQLLIKIFSTNMIDIKSKIDETHVKLYKMYLEDFILRYNNSTILDIELNECNKKDSHIHVCPNNQEIIVCNDYDVNVEHYCR